MTKTLDGKVAVVTGGTSGIGLGTSRLLAERGAHVHAVGLDAATVDGSARITFHELDVTSESDVDAFFGGLPALDILVPAAGISLGDKEHDPDAFATVVQINLLAVHRCIRAAEPLLFAGGGSVVLIASMYSFFGSGMTPAYAASKGGVAQLAKSLSQSYAPHDVRVNAIAPGWINTPLLDTMQEVAPDMYAGLLDRIPMSRFGDPVDIGTTVAFLSSDDAAYITGAIIPVDGGYLTV